MYYCDIAYFLIFPNSISASKAAVKAIIIGFVTFTMRQCSGVFAIITYASTVFRDAGSSLTKEDSSIILALIQLIGALISTNLLDRTGRKILCVISAAGTLLCLVTGGVFIYVKDHGTDVSNLQWVPLVTLSGAIIFAASGLLPLPYIITSEVCSQKVWFE